MKVRAGKPLVDVVAVAYAANQPVLLEGAHGIGKSQIMEQAAHHLGIECRVIDLSIIENTDLPGLPQIQDGRVQYALPTFLPTSGKGLLVFEELNRCPRYLQAPTLQLLTARRLNEYRLPNGWLPCACINPASNGYHAEELDAALASRFLRVGVVPDVGEWVGWAGSSGIDSRILQYVSATPNIFDSPSSNPRAWAYASAMMQACESAKAGEETLLASLSGLIGDELALAFRSFLSNDTEPMEPVMVIERYHEEPIRETLLRYKKLGRMDVVSATLHKMQVHLQSANRWEELSSNPTGMRNFEKFLRDLPGDLRTQMNAFLKSRGYVKGS